MAEKITLDAKPTRSSYYDTNLVNLLPSGSRVRLMLLQQLLLLLLLPLLLTLLLNKYRFTYSFTLFLMGKTGIFPINGVLIGKR